MDARERIEEAQMRLDQAFYALKNLAELLACSSCAVEGAVLSCHLFVIAKHLDDARFDWDKAAELKAA